MESLASRSLQLALGLSLGSVLLAATEPAPAGPPASSTVQRAAPTASEPVLVLPTVTVSQSRIRQIDNEIRKLDKLIVREGKKLKSTELDKALNNTQLSTAAALFGGNSAEHLAAVAASRMGLLQTERSVLESMKRPATREALAMMDVELEQLRTTRRNLDKVGR